MLWIEVWGSLWLWLFHYVSVCYGLKCGAAFGYGCFAMSMVDLIIGGWMALVIAGRPDD
jgi:hypothetical protein